MTHKSPLPTSRTLDNHIGGIVGDPGKVLHSARILSGMVDVQRCYAEETSSIPQLGGDYAMVGRQLPPLETPADSEGQIPLGDHTGELYRVPPHVVLIDSEREDVREN